MNIVGRLYYPLGFYWLSINLARRFNQFWIQSSSEQLPKSFSKELYNLLNNASYVIKFLNLFFFPGCTFLILIAFSYLTGYFNDYPFIWSIFVSLPSVLLADNFFPTASYSFNTRAIGLFLCSSLILMQTCLMRLDKFSSPLDFNIISSSIVENIFLDYKFAFVLVYFCLL